MIRRSRSLTRQISEVVLLLMIFATKDSGSQFDIEEEQSDYSSLVPSAAPSALRSLDPSFWRNSSPGLQSWVSPLLPSSMPSLSFRSHDIPNVLPSSAQPSESSSAVHSRPPSSPQSSMPSSATYEKDFSTESSLDPSQGPSMEEPPPEPPSEPSLTPSSKTSTIHSDKPKPSYDEPSLDPSSESLLIKSELSSSTPSSIPPLTYSEETVFEPSLEPSSEQSSEGSVHSTLPSLMPSAILSLTYAEEPSIETSNDTTIEPSNETSNEQSNEQSNGLSNRPSDELSNEPSNKPSNEPSPETSEPSLEDSSKPWRSHSEVSSSAPSSPMPPSTYSKEPPLEPSLKPSSEPSLEHSSKPWRSHSEVSSSAPSSSMPPSTYSKEPPLEPSLKPSSEGLVYSKLASLRPSSMLSLTDAEEPSDGPSSDPSELSSEPSSDPSSHHSKLPSVVPSSMPSSEEPSSEPSLDPSSNPSLDPSSNPSLDPSSMPTMVPSSEPSLQPSFFHSLFPSLTPSVVPSLAPSREPSSVPSALRSQGPSSRPSSIPTPILSEAPSFAPSTIPSTPPSVGPSVSPSSEPSHKPSIEPSFTPSAIPSSRPTVSPSAPPSSNPSYEPSMGPSIAPSSGPSAFPSAFPSAVHSASPSNVPSVTPSGDPSASPSVAPSLVPSTGPSALPSSTPSIFPSLFPTVVASSEPSAEPSPEPSTPPTRIPSSVPSDRPSLVPSVMPTPSPTNIHSAEPTISMVPSSYPTSLPSQIPSPGPSSWPSQLPSTLPSHQPSEAPSVLPSESPSSSPTLSCHDVANYTSPINDFRCIDHNGTNCITWRFLGLNVDQVEELIESCPISCKVDCGSLARFEVNATFRIADVPSFLSPESVNVLDDISVAYLTKYIHDEIGSESSFFLYQAELLSQQIVHRHAERRLRFAHARRRLQASGRVDLRVNFAFRGMSIDLSDEVVEPLLVEGLGSEGFTTEIQRSGDGALLGARVTGVGPAAYLTASEGGGDGGLSKGAITATVLVVSSVLAGIAAFFLHKLRRRKIPELKQAASPLHSPVDSVRSPIGSVFSFESNMGMVASFVRLVSSGQASETSTSVEEEGSSSQAAPDSDSPEDTSPHSDQSTESEKSEAETEDDDDEEEEEEEEIHPFTGIIPPMIIVDNIEDDKEWDQPDDEGSDGKKMHGGVKNVVPSRHVEASSDFVAALNDHTKPFDPTAFESVLYSPLDTITSFSFHDSNRLSMFRVISSEDDDASACSTPLLSIDDEEKCARGIRRVLSEGAMRDEPIDLVSVPPMMDLAPPSPPASKKPKSRRLEASDSSMSLRSDSAGRQSPISGALSPSPSSDKERTASDISALRRGYHSDGQEEMTKDTAPSKLFAALFTRSPAKATRKPASWMDSPSAAGQERGAPSPVGRFLGHHSRQSSRSSFSSTQERESNEEAGIQYIFQAPRKGKLGLVIGINANGPTVMQVKDYSPLLGQVLPGDRIVSIDGVKTIRMTLSEVTSLLSKPASRRSSPIQIVLLRPPDSKKIQDLNDNFSEQSSSFLEKPDTSSDHEGSLSLSFRTSDTSGDGGDR